MQYMYDMFDMSYMQYMSYIHVNLCKCNYEIVVYTHIRQDVLNMFVCAHKR